MQRKCNLFILITLMAFVYVIFTISKYAFQYQNIKTPVEEKFTSGSCSLQASKMGSSQKIISYSVYGEVNSPYWWGFSSNVLWILKLYPGWLIRVYTDNPGPLLHLEKEYPKIFFICDIRNLPPPITNLTDNYGTIWRFFPLGDSQVDVVNFRDTDSRITEREVSADKHWLQKTNKSLHIMRDHTSHPDAILAGMWGVRMTPQNRNIWLKLRNNILNDSHITNGTSNKLDQELLKKYVFLEMMGDAMTHDSYHCKEYPESVPFPTKRVGKEHVGAAFYRGMNGVIEECPIQCRPKNHLDWTYC